jgi:uncharacterized membrane protein (UPF0127 family)
MTAARAFLLAMLFTLPAACGAAPSDAPAAAAPLKASKQTDLTLPDGKTLRVDVVDTPFDRERGLMYRKNLPADYGMLFVFPAEMPMSFWMKNTLVPLDMLFIGSDKKVNVLHENVKASKLDTPDEKVARAGGVAQFVLELPAGAIKRRKLKKGDALKFDAPIPGL